jgi:hypothetical protein
MRRTRRAAARKSAQGVSRFVPRLRRCQLLLVSRRHARVIGGVARFSGDPPCVRQCRTACSKWTMPAHRDCVRVVASVEPARPSMNPWTRRVLEILRHPVRHGDLLLIVHHETDVDRVRVSRTSSGRRSKHAGSRTRTCTGLRPADFKASIPALNMERHHASSRIISA